MKNFSKKRWQRLAGILKEGSSGYDLPSEYDEEPYEGEFDSSEYDEQRGIGQSEVDGDFLGQLESDIVDEIVRRMTHDGHPVTLETAKALAEEELQDVFSRPEDLGYSGRTLDMIFDEFGEPEDTNTPSDEKINDLGVKAFYTIAKPDRRRL
jgi:hypothetical protein